MTEKTLTKRKIVLKPKNYMCFLILGVLLVLFAVLYYTGNMKRSSARLLHQIAYSIILAVSLNLVVGFLGELSLGHAGFMYVGAIIGCYAGSLLGKFIPVPLVTLILSLIVGGAVAAVFGLIIGLVAAIVACVAVVVTDRTDTRLRDYEDIPRKFNLPVLGVVPRIETLAQEDRENNKNVRKGAEK